MEHRCSIDWEETKLTDISKLLPEVEDTLLKFLARTRIRVLHFEKIRNYA